LKKKIAIFASGSGSNAQQIIEYFKDHPHIEVDAIYTNNSKAGVIQRAERFGISSFVFEKISDIYDTLENRKTELVVLAGYLKLIPKSLIAKFPQKIINIHPALLPKYGGKGMYGKYVHQAVFDNKEKQSGISIHFVNEDYDEGNIIYQNRVNLVDEDTPDTIAKKVLALEHAHYAPVIEKLLN